MRKGGYTRNPVVEKGIHPAEAFFVTERKIRNQQDEFLGHLSLPIPYRTEKKEENNSSMISDKSVRITLETWRQERIIPRILDKKTSSCGT